MNIKREKIFNVFASCKIVKGYKQAVICDLHRNNIYPIPISLYEILINNKKHTFNDLLEIYGSENEETLLEYFNFLVKEDIVFFNDEPELFPKLSDFWDEPYKITNCIIDIDSIGDNVLYIKKCIGELPIKAVQIRIYGSIKEEELLYLLENIQPVGISSMELILAFNEDFLIDNFKSICLKYPYIFTIIVYNSPEEHYILDYELDVFGQVCYTSQSIDSHKSCGVVIPDFFTINTKTYTESIEHNSCLNRKISIDVKGNLKNCPSMNESFGNIKDTTFSETLEKIEFKKYWNINKDKINVCQDCEFRYICTDCRAYVENPDDILSKPLKCGYNPYTGEWSEWSKNPIKQKAINHYGFNLS